MRNRIFMLPLIAGAMLAATPAGAAEDPKPMASAANNCGRTQLARLDPLMATHLKGYYPTEARRRNQTGRVFMRVMVGKDGLADDVTVVRSSGSAILDEASAAAVKGKWRWESPPTECRDQGVILPVAMDWYMDGIIRDNIYLDDSHYPADARARKEGGAGGVILRLSPDRIVINVKIDRSTGSPAMDEAIRQYELATKIYTPNGEQTGPEFGEEAWRQTLPAWVQFVPTPNPENIAALMGPAAAAPPSLAATIAPGSANTLPLPEHANHCGRDAKIFLPAIPSSRTVIDIPLSPPATVRMMGNYLTQAKVPEQGAMRMRVVVNAEGKVQQVAVTDSSAPPEMEKAVLAAVKDKYRWEPPPPECRDSGVQLEMDYVYSVAPPDLQIYADDPRYPAAAHERKMGGAGSISLRYKSPDRLIDSKVLLSTGSPALDESMVKIVWDILLPALKTRTMEDSETTLFNVMFMPDFIPPPRRQSANQRAGAAP